VNLTAGVALACAAAVALAITATALVARRLGRVDVVDVAWGLLFVAVAWVCAAAGTHSPRSWLLAALVTAWGGRLAWHLYRRWRGASEDPRYVALLSDAPPGSRFRYAVRRVFVVQGIAAWFVALPLAVAGSTDRALGPVGYAGLVVFAVGLSFESLGDAQLRAFKADPASRGRIMDRGLWSWTRHPNYFGEATVWWGLWLITAEAWQGALSALTVLSPVAMTYLLTVRTGAGLLEQTMAQRPGYRDYMDRTSGFVPRPPRRTRR
jgi:steroid 5-alpha reductase family enzyme